MAVQITEGTFTPAPAGSTGVLEVRNPADVRELVGTYPAIGPDYVDAAVEVAVGAQPGWARRSASERAEALAAAIATVQVEGLDRLLVREQGKILAEASLEMSYLGLVLPVFAAQAGWLDAGTELPDNGRSRTVVYQEPMGVVAIVTPWNWPFALAVISVLPALVAGNAVVLLVAPSAPLASLAAYGQLAAALPDGVLSVFTAPGSEVPQRLVEHPSVRMVSFTGSSQTGQIVMEEAAAGVKNLTLELGGNDAAILLDDVVLDEGALQRLTRGTFTTAGQVCMAIKRLYVPDRLFDRVVEGLGSVLDGWIIGDGLDAATTMGPLHNAAQLRRVQSLIDEARESGGVVHTYGKMAGDPEVGHFMLPAIVTGMDVGTRLVQEEQFGPALPVIPYSSVDAAVAMANDSEFGLCSSVWSADEERAKTVARLLETGTTWVNAHGTSVMDPRAPFGGVKNSGTGRRGGRWILESFTETHSVIIPAVQ